LERRLIEHRDGLVDGFTARYRIFRLVEFEVFGDVTAAIAREKEIKGWRREKKIRLIERANPTWADLAERLPTVYGQGVRGAGEKAGAKGEAEAKAEPKADPSRR
jgi:predicted GIY-YIG superfamily endonuclease